VTEPQWQILVFRLELFPRPNHLLYPRLVQDDTELHEVVSEVLAT
jgi:hypothetical protein